MRRGKLMRRLQARKAAPRPCGCAEHATNCDRGIHVDGLAGGWTLTARSSNGAMLLRALTGSGDDDVVAAGIRACARELRVVELARRARGGDIYEDEIAEVEGVIVERLDVLAALQDRAIEANRQRYLRRRTMGRHDRRHA